MFSLSDAYQDVVCLLVRHASVGDSSFKPLPSVAETYITDCSIELLRVRCVTKASGLTFSHLPLLDHLVEAPKDGLSLS